LPSVPGSGQILALVLRSEIQAIARFPRVPDFLSYRRRVKGAKESASKPPGLSGKKIGTPPLQGAFSAAAVLLLRQHQPGQESFADLERHHGQGKALTVRAQT
jgi:transposase